MQGTKNMKKGLAALLGLAMTATIGVGVTSVANAADLGQCDVNERQGVFGDSPETQFTNCVSKYNTGNADTINLNVDVNLSYQTVNVSNGKLGINSNGKTISHVHFAVTNGASLTLSGVNVNDDNGGLGAAQIPVFVGGVSDQVKSSFKLTSNASLNSNQGSACAFGVVVGNYADVTIDSNGAGADKGTTVYGSDAAVVTKNNSAEHIGNVWSWDCSTPQAEQVTGSTITLRSGYVEAENSDRDNTYAINSWGADVHVAGGKTVEVYVKDATYSQDGGFISAPDNDNTGELGLGKSDKYPVTVDGANAKAIIAGGKLVSNPNPNLDSEVVHVQNGATVTADNSKGGLQVPGLPLPAKQAVFAAPEQDANGGAGFTAKYNEDGFKLNFTDDWDTKNDSEKPVLRTVEAGDGPTDISGLDLIGLDDLSSNLTGSTYTPRDNVTADFSPLHSAQLVYATWTVPASALNNLNGANNNVSEFTNAGSVKLYGAAKFVPAYYDWYEGSKQEAKQGPHQLEGDSRLFAGWYDRKGSAFNAGVSVLTDPQSRAYPFAYFVSRDTQRVLVQRSAVSGGKFNVRVLSTVPNTHFYGIAYDVTINGTKVTATPKGAYAKADVKGSGKGYFTVADSAKDFGGFGDGRYWAVAFVMGVPESDKDAKITVKPYWTTEDGTQVTRGDVFSGSLADGPSVLK